MSVYLFDMPGEVIAFRRTWTDPFVFDAHGRWIGWFAWDDNDVVDPDDNFLGTVVDDRLVRRNDWFARPCPGVPEAPARVEPSGSPLTPHDFPNRFAYDEARVQPHL